MLAKVFLKKLSDARPKDGPFRVFVSHITTAVNDHAVLSEVQRIFLETYVFDPPNLHARRDPWHAMEIATFINSCTKPIK